MGGIAYREEGGDMDGVWRQRWFRAFDTDCAIKALGVGEAALDDAVRLCAAYQRSLGPASEGGDVWRINHAAGLPVQVEPDTAELIGAALRYCELTCGLFDITAGELARLWHRSRTREPSPADVERALEHTDWHMVELHGRTVALRDPQARIALGGIAKGFIADKVRDLLVERGAQGALVNLGGNIVVSGDSPEGGLWRIGIRSPDFHEREGERRARACDIAASPRGIDARQARDLALRRETPALSLRLTNKSVVTSGIYERLFVDAEAGAAHHHIVDPRTGYPSRSDVASVTVISERSLDGDGLSTALLIMGRAWAQAFVDEALPGIEAVLIDRDGNAGASAGAQAFIEAGA